MFVDMCCVFHHSYVSRFSCFIFLVCIFELWDFVWLWIFHVWSICFGNVFDFGLFEWIQLAGVCWQTCGLICIIKHIVQHVKRIFGSHVRSNCFFQWVLQTCANDHTPRIGDAYANDHWMIVNMRYVFVSYFMWLSCV